MHKFPEDLDAAVFVGRTLEMVCLNANQVYFHFNDNLSICAESGRTAVACRLQITDGQTFAIRSRSAVAWPGVGSLREWSAMAVKRRRNRRASQAASDAYEQAMLAEGAPVALDLLGLGSTIRDVVRGRRRKAAATRRTKKKVRAKAKIARPRKAKRKSRARKLRRKR